MFIMLGMLFALVMFGVGLASNIIIPCMIMGIIFIVSGFLGSYFLERDLWGK